MTECMRDISPGLLGLGHERSAKPPDMRHLLRRNPGPGNPRGQEGLKNERKDALSASNGSYPNPRMAGHGSKP